MKNPGESWHPPGFDPRDETLSSAVNYNRLARSPSIGGVFSCAPGTEDPGRA